MPEHVSYIHVVDAVIEAYKKDVDVDLGLLTEALKLSPEERLRELIRLHEFGEKLRQAYAARRPRSEDCPASTAISPSRSVPRRGWRCRRW